VSAFLDFLAELPAAEWLAIGLADAVEPHTDAILEATLSDQNLQVDAWFARDAVETLAFVASHSLPLAARRAPCTMTNARVAAERAALAILARPWLAATDLATLLAPFRGRPLVGVSRAPRRSDPPSLALNGRRR